MLQLIDQTSSKQKACLLWTAVTRCANVSAYPIPHLCRSAGLQVAHMQLFYNAVHDIAPESESRSALMPLQGIQPFQEQN